MDGTELEEKFYEEFMDYEMFEMDIKNLNNDFHSLLCVDELFQDPMLESVEFNNFLIYVDINMMWVGNNFDFHNIEIELDELDDEILFDAYNDGE